MRILMIESQKEPYVKEVDNNIESIKEIVGGELNVDYTGIHEGIVLIGCTLGLFMQLEGRSAGTSFICSINDEGEFASLTDYQIKYILNKIKLTRPRPSIFKTIKRRLI